ncbi:hypothetical protein FPV71_11830 [Listeria monocytogenes]|nr:hypothetical protein [Listeria monocytogenes]ECH5525097.1 hypothetical protein [Listeria monocytogenes]ECP0341846.1 hypothetical protein [Listeria monocytogenes]EDB6964398.1 hypothetical protein [Listeria monocytogenes]
MSGFYAEFGQVRKLDYLPTSGIKLKTSPWETTTVLGTYVSDTQNVLTELGNIKSLDFGMKKNRFNLLNAPDELYINPKQFWDEFNQPFLDKAIQRGDDIAMATKTTVENLYIAGTKQRTGFGREYEYLLQHGYTYDAKTSTMKLKK